MDALPHVLHGLQAQPGRAFGEAGGLGFDGADGLRQLVVVEERLGEAEDGVDAFVAVQARHGERGLEVADGLGGRGEQSGAAEFVQHARVGLRQRRFVQGAFQAAAGGVGCADGEVFAGGLAQLLDEFLVVVGVDLEEVAGGGCGAEAAVGDDLGGDAVPGAAQGVGDGVVDGGRDQRVHELQGTFDGLAGDRVGGGEDAGVLEAADASAGVVGAHRGELGDEVDGDAVAEDGGGPREPGGVGAEFLQAGDESAAAGGAVQGAQLTGVDLGRLQFAVLDLGEEFDGLVRVAAGDGPHLAAERDVGVLAERGAGEAGDGFGGERAEGAGAAAAAAISSSSRALTPLTSPGLRATTTRTDRSANAASQRRVSWSAQWASSMSRTSGQSRRARRRTAATRPSHTPCGSAGRSPASAMPRAGPAMSYQSPRYSRASSGISCTSAGWSSCRTTLNGTERSRSPPRADQTVQPRDSASRRVSASSAVLPMPASPPEHQ
ncbi:hypothetical protein GCM10020256_07960 [Streptomyces thermocoprophilus]